MTEEYISQLLRDIFNDLLTTKFKSKNKLALYLGLNQSQFNRFLNGEQAGFNSKTLDKIFRRLNIIILLPGEPDPFDMALRSYLLDYAEVRRFPPEMQEKIDDHLQRLRPADLQALSKIFGQPIDTIFRAAQERLESEQPEKITTA
jgi:transcriptional regulator with XRE-family HTH domain